MPNWPFEIWVGVAASAVAIVTAIAYFFKKDDGPKQPRDNFPWTPFME